MNHLQFSAKSPMSLHFLTIAEKGPTDSKISYISQKKNHQLVNVSDSHDSKVFRGGPRDPGSLKLRMVWWNLNLFERFGGDCTPKSSSDKVSQDPYKFRGVGTNYFTSKNWRNFWTFRWGQRGGKGFVNPVMTLYGCFLKWWYPQTPQNDDF